MEKSRIRNPGSRPRWTRSRLSKPSRANSGNKYFMCIILSSIIDICTILGEVLWIRICVRVNKITKLILKHLLNVKKKKNHALKISYFFRFRPENEFPTNLNPNIRWLSSSFPFILNLGSGSTDPN